jgi:hypothetical protein
MGNAMKETELRAPPAPIEDVAKFSFDLNPIRGFRFEEAMSASIAISLRRIADALEIIAKDHEPKP